MPTKFYQRHIGPNKKQIKEMLSYLRFSSFDEFIDKAIPNNILSDFSDKYFDSIKADFPQYISTDLNNILKEADIISFHCKPKKSVQDTKHIQVF